MNTQNSNLVNAVKHLCTHYLFNQWLKFDQTSTDAQIHHQDGGKKWLDFGDLQGHHIINTQKGALLMKENVCVHNISLTNGWK